MQECRNSQKCRQEFDREMWQATPDIVLEEIFAMLTVPQRYNCSMVCRYWYEIFFSPHVWRHLVLDETSFTRRRYAMYKGYVREVSSRRFHLYLEHVGYHSRCITFAPISNFFNLYEFLRSLCGFLEILDDDADYRMPLLDQFDFTFACESRGRGDTFITGTGGQILAELRKLLTKLHSLTKLRLNQLLLDPADAPRLLESVAKNCSNRLHKLEILNCTKKRFPLIAIAELSRLRVLVISPPQMSAAVLTAIVRRTQLAELILVQDRYTKVSPEDDSIPGNDWAEIRRIAPHLRVRLERRGCLDNQDGDILIQDGAPVDAVVYSTNSFQIVPGTIVQIIEQYRLSLKIYGHLGFCRRFQSKSFKQRADSLLVMLVRHCPNLNCLVVRDRISTATILILATEGSRRSMDRLIVRRNSVILRCDWPRSIDWTDEFYDWLRATSRSYEGVEEEVSRMFGRRWKMLTDAQFKKVHV